MGTGNGGESDDDSLRSGGGERNGGKEMEVRAVSRRWRW